MNPEQKFKAVECATLGTEFRDIVDENGDLFACQVDKDAADMFVSNPLLLWDAIENIPKLRGWCIEQVFESMKKAKP